MKHIFKSILFLIIVSIAFPGCGQQSASKKEPINTEKPLIVVTGFSSDIKNISQSELKSKWQKGNVYCLTELTAAAGKYFGNNNGIAINNLDSFALLAHNKLLICDLEHLCPQLIAISIDSIDYFDSPSKYPLYVNGNFEPIDSAAFTWVTITGVTALSRGSGMVADSKGLEFLIDGVKDQFSHTDFLHISNEVSFTEDCQYVSKTMQFCTKKEDFEIFKMLGVDIVELTGNHNRDYGKQPFIDTYNWYADNGMKTFGGGRNPSEAAKPLVIDICNGQKMAFIGFNELCPCGECADDPGEPGANRWNKVRAKNTIDSLRNAGVGFIVVTVQFGEVDSYAPTPTQKSITHFLIDAGADLVYGSQAHQIQQFEFYKGKPIMNGLGNFLFDQIHRIGVRQSCFVHLIFYQGKLIQLKPVFTMMGLDRQLRVATPEEEAAMRKEVVNYK